MAIKMKLKGIKDQFQIFDDISPMIFQLHWWSCIIGGELSNQFYENYFSFRIILLHLSGEIDILEDIILELLLFQGCNLTNSYYYYGCGDLMNNCWGCSEHPANFSLF